MYVCGRLSAGVRAIVVCVVGDISEKYHNLYRSPKLLTFSRNLKLTSKYQL